MKRQATTVLLSLLAPTYAIYREVESAGRLTPTPFRRFHARNLILEAAAVALGAVAAATGIVADIRLVAWIGMAWLVAAGLEFAARLVVPSRWIGSEERFQAVFSARGLIRIAVIVLFVLSVARANWFGAALLAFVLGTLWMQGFVPVLFVRWLEARRQRHVG